MTETVATNRTNTGRANSQTSVVLWEDGSTVTYLFDVDPETAFNLAVDRRPEDEKLAFLQSAENHAKLVGIFPKNPRGELHGICEYYVNGQLIEKCAYVDGEKHGECVRYHLNGAISAKGLYEQDKRQGLWLKYHDNGMRRAEGAYKDDLQDGEWKYFNENGILERVEIYKTGLLLSTLTPDGHERLKKQHAMRAEKLDFLP